ncbi:glycosyltransferase family 4 protein [Patescibacteria group bacterium]
MKHILIATGLYPPEIGGPATYSKLLGNELPKHGFEVDVLPFSKVRHLPKIVRHIAYFFAILGKGKSADLIYAQDPVSVGLPSMIAAKILRKKFFIRIAGDYAWEQGVQRYGITDDLDKFSTRLREYNLPTRVLKKIQKTVAKMSDTVIVPSYYFKKIITNWGVDSQKINVIYNGVDLNFDKIKKDKSSEKILLSVGRLVPWKGFKELIQMIPDILKEDSNIKLHIAGDGPDMEKLRKIIKDLNLENDVVLLGKVSREELLKQKQSADIFVFNTHWESFSFDTIECMVLGLPVIATNVGPLPELIVNGKEGILVEPNNKEQIKNAVIKILRDDDFRLKIIQNAREKSKKFSIDNTLNNLKKLLINSEK